MPVTRHKITAFKVWCRAKVWLCCCNSCIITSVQISVAFAWCHGSVHAFIAHVQESSTIGSYDCLQTSAASLQMLSQTMSNLSCILFSSVAVSREWLYKPSEPFLHKHTMSINAQLVHCIEQHLLYSVADLKWVTSTS